jgi:hypothetical protein
LGRSASPLQGLVSGSLDLDKLEYLKRDATFCGVPYGEIDVDRLLASLRVLTDPETGNVEIGVATQGVAALESLLFAKYQMFRNVYWHHGVRAATVTFQRLSRDALLDGWVAPAEVVGKGDEELLSLIEAGAAGHDSDGARRARELFIPAIRHRRLPKRAAEWLGDAIQEDVSPWFHERPDLRSALEDHLAEEFALRPGELFLDYPAKPRMLELDILMLRKDGGVQRLTAEGYAGLIDLPRLSRDLYHAARVLRVFTFKPVVIEQPNRVIELVTASQREVEALVSAS